MFVHCCHCTWCQRESGSAFAINALIESFEIRLTAGETEDVLTRSASGNGQTIVRCPDCRIALWSYYGSAREKLAFLRVGTLAEAHLLPPDIHIFTSTKVPWLVLPGDIPVMTEYYRRSKYWPESSQERYKRCLAA